MKQKHVIASVVTRAVLGAGATFLALHNTTRYKVVKHAKRIHNNIKKAVKEQIEKAKYE